jgi:hypothetical protein
MCPMLNYSGRIRLVRNTGFPTLMSLQSLSLEIAHVAAWLRVSERTIERLDIPFALLGKRTKRYLAADVIEFLHNRRVA